MKTIRLVTAIVFAIFVSVPLSFAADVYPKDTSPGKGNLISMDFQDINLKTVLKVFSQQSGMNFIASQNVQDRTVTIYFDNVKVEDALNYIMNANNLSYEQEPGTNIFIVKETGKPEVETITKIYELKYAQDIPPKVAINEAIELAKTYSGVSSGKFINGVLGSIYKDMQEKGEKKDLEKEPPREFSAGGVVYRQESDNYMFIVIYDAYDKWTFPKGHIKEEEDQEKAAKREIGEEVGIKQLVNQGYLGSIDIKVNEPNKRAVPKTVHYYLFETSETNIKIAKKEPGVQEAKWATQVEVLEIIGYENAKEIFIKALELLKLK